MEIEAAESRSRPHFVDCVVEKCAELVKRSRLTHAGKNGFSTTLLEACGVSRLSDATYLLQYSRLKTEWESSSGSVFVVLSPTDQWALHDFYVCTKKLSVDEVLAHRRTVTVAQPSLPQRAGKAFKKIEVFLDMPPRVPMAPVHPDGRRRKAGAKRNIWVQSQVRPDIDPNVLAKIVVQHVLEQHAKAKRESLNS